LGFYRTITWIATRRKVFAPDLQRSIRAGIVKIHVGSTFEMPFRGALRRSLRSDRIVDPRFYQASVRTALTERASAVLEAISCGDPLHSSA
jgi:fructose/tagatose bisphosphate aldolase